MRRALAGVLTSLLLAGCAGDNGLRCEDTERYQNAESVGPIRVPDDLSVPDESEALRIPPAPSDALEAERDPASCLEDPPDFFEGELGARAPD
ncbi:MAG TPA: hypothetical protein VF329_12635 [Gammaproteobacteria bacterium]